MIPRATTIALLASAVVMPHLAATPEGVDGMLSFSNGDQLHGRFIGITPDSRLQWQRDDLEATPAFEFGKIRRIVLRGGRPASPLTSISHAALVNGDRIPGTIVSLDDEHAVLETEFAGTLTIPRGHLGMIAPNPFGGRVAYQGPFNTDLWEIAAPQDAQPPEPADEDDEEAPAPDEETTTDPPADPEGWTHSGAAWYWPGKGDTTALIRRGDMGDRSILRCHVSWKSRISLAIAFHADFQQRPPAAADDPEEDEDEIQRRARNRRVHPGDTSIYPEVFGNCYVVQLNPTHAMLFRSSMAEDGTPQVDRLQTHHSNVRLGESGSAIVEIRANRSSGEIVLFIDGDFVAQWSETGNINNERPQDAYAGRGDGFGFLMQTTGTAARITDVIVADWNGMPDAARSLQIDEADIVLLSNGTDRFSGTVTSIADGGVSLTGRYGDFRFPVDEVSEIRFARNSLASVPDATPGQIRLRIHPLGILSGTPISANTTSLAILNPSCGQINVDLDPVILIENHDAHSFLDAWDPEF